ATVIFDRLAAMDPDNPQLEAILAHCLIRQQNYRRAEQILEFARVRNPNSAAIHFQSGVLQFFSNDWAGSARSFQRALQLTPDYGEASYNLGQSLMRLGDRQSAMTAFRETIRIRPDYAAAYTNLGKLLIEAGEHNAGRAALETAVTLAPNDSQTIELLG